MSIYIALIRALNVGGTGLLAMEELRQICVGLGLTSVATYIQSGNVIFRTEEPATDVALRLDVALGERLGKAPGVFLRRPDELTDVLNHNPFRDLEPNRVLVSFFGEPLPDDALSGLVAPDGEQAVLGGREIYVHYPLGSGRSKFKLPALKAGTSRNINTVAKLAELGHALETTA